MTVTLPVVGTLPTPGRMEADVPPVLDQERISCWPGETAGGFAEKNEMTGAVAGETATLRVFEVEPLAFEAVRVTLKVPAFVQACVGFCAVEVWPSRKLQSHEMGLPEEVS